MNKEAYKALMKGRSVLFVQQPFFGSLSLLLELVEVDDEKQCPTMAVDGKHLFYNPKFTLSLSSEEVLGVLAHEVYHCAFKHMTRRGHRHHVIYNMAGDLVINLDLIACGLKLPGKPINMNSPPGERGYLYDPQFKDMGTEAVYERLIQDVKFVEVRVTQGGDVGGCGEVRDAPGTKPGEKNEIVEMEWEGNVRTAIEVATKNAGTLPGHLARLVKELNKPKINWREQLRDFIAHSMIKEYSWSRPNRRSAGSAVLRPGLISDSMQHLITVMDCSGSVSEPIMKMLGSEAGGALDDGVCDKMTVIYTDTKVQKVEEFLRGELLTISTPGGGGTDFKEVMEYIRENVADAQAIIFLTDMYTHSFGEDPGIPTLWGSITPLDAIKGVEVPFGRVIEVPPSEATV